MQAKKKPKPQMIVTIRKDKIKLLDRLAKSVDRSRSALIRQWIDAEYEKKFGPLKA